ncbi:MAG: Mur ligase family protein [Traorella sp.]
MPKKLCDCLQSIGIESDEQRIIDKVSRDSRECDENSIYVGNVYQKEALNQNAYVVDEQYLRPLLNYYYDDPSQHYFVIGVTGTNGKTSVTHYLKEILTSLGFRCIRLGTHYNEFEDKKVKSINTTMDIMNNLDIFLKYQGKIDCIIMEISSIAIEEHRLDFICFDRIIYTNLAQDHLDYHKTFVQYMYSKFKLRHFLKENGRILVNFDDYNLKKILDLERIHILPYRFADLSHCYQDFFIQRFEVCDVLFETRMMGDFVLMNLWAALACILSMNLNLEACQKVVSSLQNVEGRMEMIKHHDIYFVIDYAHTPLALELACCYLNKYKKNRLWVVFGCGGERDRQKRKQMAQIACQMGDEVIVCEDNNRLESFEQIVSDMQLDRFFNVRVIEKRKNALKCALTLAQKHDIILVAGKGNEAFLFTGGRLIPYNDKEWILSL